MTADAPARHAIQTRLDATLFVEAGAGTGKTSALVSRIVELVTAGVPMRHIAAITFTEAAAAELRDRVRSALERAARAGSVGRAAVAQLDEAAISTLHSFAQRLVTEHPLEAGLPPSIEVLDEIGSELDFDERWRMFMDELFAAPSYEDVLLRSFALDVKVDALRDLAVVFLDQRDRLKPLPTQHPPLSPVDTAPVVAALRAAETMVEHCVDDTDHLFGHLGGFREWGDRLAAADDELEAIHLLATLPKFDPRKGRKPSWSCSIDDVRAATGLAETARQEALCALREEVLVRLVEAVREFTVRSAVDRQMQGRLVFHDLLVSARDLLRSSDDVRAHLHERFSHILIDEFQDTDPLQVELAVLLATRDADVGERAWQDLALEPGRLFFVGDPKQSIYRFRRADIDLFLSVRASTPDDVVRLTTNFRSVPGIISWLNAAFGELIGSGAGAGQPAYEPLTSHRAAASDGVAVHHFGYEHERTPMSQVRGHEAGELAGAIRAIVGTWQVGSPEGDTRPARYDDIAILIPTRTGLPQLEAALDDADVPYRVESSSLVWSTQQVRELLSVLRSVDDPNDEVSLVAALRSPVLGCSDDDLLSYWTAGGRWDHTAPAPEGLDNDHPVVAGMAALARLHEQRWWLGVSGMLDRVVRQLGFFEQAFAHRRPRDHWRRLRFVTDQARAFEEEPGATLRGFLGWAERQSTEEARVREPVLPESDDHAVRILTVHGAKGLEFPIVMLCGLNRRHQRNASSVRVLWDPDGRCHAKIGKSSTSGFAALADDENQMERLERLRLLYVAATRARDHLIVSLHRKPGTCDASLLFDAIEKGDAGDLWAELTPPTLALSPPSRPDPVPEPADRPEARQRWLAERAELLEACRRAPTRSATSVADALDRTGAAGGTVRSFPGPRGRAGTSIGRAVHACLQTVDLVGGLDIEPIALAAATAEGIGELADQVAQLVAAAIASPTVAEAAGRRHWRELYVGVPIAGTLIEGFIDLLYEDGDSGLIVVDYKTDQLRSTTDEDAAVERYRMQLATYALALDHMAFGLTVTGAVLLFVSGASARARRIEDLPAAVAEVQHLLEASQPLDAARPAVPDRG